MAADVDIAELSLESAGQRLRRARIAVGLTLAEVSTATKIPERSLTAIEEGRFSALPSRIYAIGFSRSYARLVGLDEGAVATEIRAELDGAAPAQDISSPQAFVPGDPARVPGRRLALIAGLGALAVFVGGMVFWHGGLDTSGSLPSILPADNPAIGHPPGGARAARKPAATAPASPIGSSVAVSALAPGIWLKVYEASGKKLFEGQLAQGQSFTVPADAQAPMIWTGRPDALAISVAGKPVPKLSDRQRIVKVPISAAALLARNTLPATAARPVAPVPAATVAQ